MSAIKKLSWFRLARNCLCNADLSLRHIQIADESAARLESARCNVRSIRGLAPQSLDSCSNSLAASLSFSDRSKARSPSTRKPESALRSMSAKHVQERRNRALFDEDAGAQC